MEKEMTLEDWRSILSPTQPEFWFQTENPFDNFYIDIPITSSQFWQTETPVTTDSDDAERFVSTVGAVSTKSTKGKKLSGYIQQDLEQFNQMYDELGETKFREFLTKIAGLESRWQNNPKGNDTHSGLYQIKNTYLEHYTGVKGITKEQFVNNPKLQTKAALTMAKENYNQIIKDTALLKAAKQRGYNEWDLMAGAWLAGYSGMRRQFFTGKEVGDANGTTITKRMNDYKNMQI